MSSHIEVAIKNLQPQTVAYISMRGPYTKVQQAFGTLFGWLGQKGLVPVGPPSGAFFNAPGQVPEEQLLWELRCPVAGDVLIAGPDDKGLGISRLKPPRWQQPCTRARSIRLERLGTRSPTGLAPTGTRLLALESKRISVSPARRGPRIS